MPSSVNKSDSDPVRGQYERWVYPAPIADVEEYVKKGGHYTGDPRFTHLAYWPDRDYRDDLRILVAGCGSFQAAVIAYYNQNAQVTGIDFSAASLSHTTHLKEKHGLAGLTLHQMKVEDVESLGQEFDLVVSTGVLHHLPSPETGLIALRNVLATDGVISLMLYGYYGRFGVYMMQELFALLGLEQTASDLEIVKSTIGNLPPNHPVKYYVESTRNSDLSSDAGMVDTFLHKQDQAYSVRDCLKLVEQCELVFQGWLENNPYYPTSLPAEYPLTPLLMAMDDRNAWIAMELLTGGLGAHSFYVCKPDRPENQYRIRFEDAGFLDYIPKLKPGIKVAQAPDEATGFTTCINRLSAPTTILTLDEARLFECIGNNTNMRDCINKANLGISNDDAVELARRFIKRMWQLGHVMIRKPSS